MKDNRKIGVADFETTLQEPVKVWLAGVKDLYDSDMDISKNSFRYFDNFRGWFYHSLENYKQVFFHNEKFDASYILNELHKMGYEYFDPNRKIRGKKQRRPKTKRTYSIDIDLMGIVYEVKVQNEFGQTLRINDSLKLFQFSVKKLGKSVGLDKAQINENNDYSRYIIDKDSIHYLHIDIEIPRRMLQALRDEGYQKKTIASCSLDSYKKLIGKKKFIEWFPCAEARGDHQEIMHRYCNQAYDGGISYTYGNIQRECGYGLIIDNNSMYPAQCLNRMLPHGTPIDDEGNELKPEKYIQYNKWQSIENTLSIMEVYIKYAHIKSDYPPCIRAKECNDLEGYTTALYNMDNPIVSDEKWLSTIFEYHAIITEVDYNLLMECYENVNVKVVSYMRFKAQRGMFDKYFKHWGDRKVKHGKEGNEVLRAIDKMFMNSLTGKFGTNVDANYKIPYFENDVLKFTNNNVLYGTDEVKASIYVPVIAFITAWGRRTLVDAIHNIGTDVFNYTDTDSVHMGSDEELEVLIKEALKTECMDKINNYLRDKGVKIDDNELGYWAVEGICDRGKYIRPKTYIEHIIAEPDKHKYNITKIDVKACGMSDGVKKHCNFDNFKTNSCWCVEADKEKYEKKNLDVIVIPEKDAKLMPRQVKGGCLLTPTGFTINRISMGK